MFDLSDLNFNDFSKSLKNYFYPFSTDKKLCKDINDFEIKDNGFVWNGKNYTVTINVPDKVSVSDIDVELKNDEILEVRYDYKKEYKNGGYSSMKGSFLYALPTLANPETVDVEFDSEKKTIVVSVERQEPVAKLEYDTPVKKIQVNKTYSDYSNLKNDINLPFE